MIGKRVKYNERGLQWATPKLRKFKYDYTAKRGVVLSFCVKHPGCVRVKWDGHVKHDAMPIPERFLEVIEEPVGELA